MNIDCHTVYSAYHRNVIIRKSNKETKKLTNVLFKEILEISFQVLKIHR